jgi:RNA polymerase sigma factor (sigma-70 family)
MRNHSPSDPDLLDEWLRHQREPAFHALVSRYAGLVHATARRTCGDESMAAEVSQLTFITLARKARSLVSCVSLGGWLHRTAMMHAKNLIRQTHRENRKRQQLAMQTPSHSHHDTWREIQPVLDDALAALSDKDREALLLRFYRSLTVREVAATLGIATDAAQKRIDRATERLRSKLIRRGCQSGGTLAATLLAGFSADAQAALPVSILASKAIAAGAAGSLGGLSALFATIATLMKTSPWMPPVVTLLVAGLWTGSKYQSLATLEAGNARKRDQIAHAQTSGTSVTVKTPDDDRPINWKRLATEKENGPEMQRLLRRLQSMTRREMIDALDRIAILECPKARRIKLESAVISPLGQIDSEWVLNRFENRLRDNELPLDSAFGNWAGKDLAKATAWLDAQIAAGNFTSEQLDESVGYPPRRIFEAALIGVLLATDSGAADRRLVAFPDKQRASVVSLLTNRMSNRVLNEPLTEGNHLAFANLVRSQLPADHQAPMLADCIPYFWGTGEFPKFNAYMDVIEATPAERIACAGDFSGNHIRMLSNKRKVTLGDMEALRGHFAGISPHDVDVMTARSLAEAVKGRNSSMMFPQASGLAVELLEASGSDAVLATFLEIASFDEPHMKLGRELAGKVSDESRRAEIMKRFD